MESGARQPARPVERPDMVTSSVSANNKAVVFRGRPQKEFARAYKRGLISDAAWRKVNKKKFAKKAGHNPPKPEHSQPTLDPPPGPFTQGDYKYDDTPTPEQRERERAAGKIDALGLKNIGSQMERDPQGVTRGSQLYVKKERGLPRMR